MRYLMVAAAAVLTAWMLLTPPTRAAKSYNLSLRGMEVSGGAHGTLTLVGKSSGPLPGSFEMTVRYDPATNVVTGGTWKLTVSRQERGGACVVNGSLSGSVDGGTLKLAGRGRMDSAEGIRMTVRRGTGNYACVAAGAGELAGTMNLRRPHPFMGTLRVSF